ncbi:MAG: hypothetical protein HY917_05185 [Candidatus Diapherotrites archaeon]|nr:hypothetical protein [Candidatus Diapherotrites archaeon]
MELSDFNCVPCASRTSYDFLPKKETVRDLIRLSDALEEKGVYVDLVTETVLMIQLEKKRISIFRNGKITVRDTPTKEEALATAEKLLRYL